MDSGKFTILVSSHVDYERLRAEVHYENQMVAVISQEQGIQHPQIEIWPRRDKNEWRFGYSEFLQACANAYKRLEQTEPK